MRWQVRALRWIGDRPGATSLVETVHAWSVSCSLDELVASVWHLQRRGLRIEYQLLISGGAP